MPCNVFHTHDYWLMLAVLEASLKCTKRVFSSFMWSRFRPSAESGEKFSSSAVVFSARRIPFREYKKGKKIRVKKVRWTFLRSWSRKKKFAHEGKKNCVTYKNVKLLFVYTLKGQRWMDSTPLTPKRRSQKLRFFFFLPFSPPKPKTFEYRLTINRIFINTEDHA